MQIAHRLKVNRRMEDSIEKDRTGFFQNSMKTDMAKTIDNSNIIETIVSEFIFLIL